MSVDPLVDETGQPYAYTGDDPVNGVDPLGLWGWNPISDVEQAAGDANHDADDVGHFLKDPNRWRAEASFWAGAGNATIKAAEFATEGSLALYGPQLTISNPYCEDSGFYTGGEIFGGVETAIASLGVGLVGEAGVAGESAGAAGGGRVVIGATEDLLPEGAIGAGERTLMPQLVGDLGSPEANWARNEQVLLREMELGQPIRDASVDSVGNLRLEGSGRFINLERELLLSKGWGYNPSTTLWSPP